MGAEEEGGTAHKQTFILCPFEKTTTVAEAVNVYPRQCLEKKSGRDKVDLAATTPYRLQLRTADLAHRGGGGGVSMPLTSKLMYFALSRNNINIINLQ
jgi:hypothetical protein